jgi:hypothetical protein
MFKQLIKLLNDIQEINWEGNTPTESYLELREHKQEVIDKADKLKLIDFSGQRGKVDYELTEKGYNLLQNHNNTLISKEMLLHTKTMKKLTLAIFIFTIINLILIGVQIYLIIK